MNVLIGQPQSVPNITGNFYNYGAGGGVSVPNPYSADGCFSRSNGSNTNPRLVMDDNPRTRTTVNFDASRSNSTYGRRTEVAPNSLTYKIWVRTA